MSIFKNIDKHIISLAEKLNADLSIDRPNYPAPLRTFEERRIDWIHNKINKAIIIQPNFERNGVNSELWNFVIVAWDTGNGQTKENSWSKVLIREKSFNIIENRVSNLLELGLLELNSIQSADLEPIKGTYLFLDLDGVLITTPSWKSDEIDDDGYSKFNHKCVQNLNNLLGVKKFQIWLSSSRRESKTIEEFNQIFANRHIKDRITGFLPLYAGCKNRKEEILKFLAEKNITKFIILDDDKSLNSLEEKYKMNFILTNQQVGFMEDELKGALRIINQKNSNLST